MKIDVQLVREALRRFNRRVGVLKSDPYGIGLSLSQGSALVDIGRFEALKPNDLVRLLRLDKSSVSRMIDVLVEKKLVVISHDPSDGRSKNLTLTSSGKKAVKVINEALDRSVSEVFEHLDAKDQKTLVIAFKKLAGAVDQADKDPIGSSIHSEYLV